MHTCSITQVMQDSSVTPWAVACQALLSMEFSRQEYWAGLLFPNTRDLPNTGIEPCALIFFTTEPLWKPLNMCMCFSEYMFRYNHFVFYNFFIMSMFYFIHISNQIHKICSAEKSNLQHPFSYIGNLFSVNCFQLLSCLSGL